MRRLLAAGADKVGMNTSAVTNPDLISEGADQFGSQCVVVAIDARRVPGEDRWEVFTRGGRTATGLDAVAWAKECAERGAGEILLTSMDRDGTLTGYDLELLQAINEAVNIPVIASGGAGELSHFADAIQQGGADAVLAASLFHFGTLRVGEVKSYLHDQGVKVRMENGQ
jgi:cyclase